MFSNLIIHNSKIDKFIWANPSCTAILGQPATEVEQAPTTPSDSKNQVNICVSFGVYQMLS